MLTVNMYINIPYFFLPKCQGYYKKINRTGNYVYKQDHMQSKGENKAPTIINTGKYTINQLVCITYQSINYVRNILNNGLLVKSVIGPNDIAQFMF
jgi:hypothetical protein